MNLIKEHNPDLVFLDVQMPGLDGFGVIKKLLDKKIRLPKIVFATAFDQYAVKAFEVNAVDYLLKPFDKKRVTQAIQKARAQQDADEAPAEKFETLVQHAGIAEAASLKNSAEIAGANVPGRPERYLLCLDRRWRDHGRDRGRGWHGRPVELPHVGRTAGEPGQQAILARSSLLPREYQPHPRSRPWFKSSYQLRMDDKKQTEIPVSRAQTKRLRELFGL